MYKKFRKLEADIEVIARGLNLLNTPGTGKLTEHNCVFSVKVPSVSIFTKTDLSANGDQNNEAVFALF